jgi:hypothetical protein
MVLNGEWGVPPVMQLGSEDVLRFSFDEMSHVYHRYTYRVQHCNADWQESELLELDYLEGFNDLVIEDWENSKNTTQLYTHYQFTIPNDEISLKVSGNYRVQVFDDELDDENPVAVFEFSVVEPLLSFNVNISGDTDVSFNEGHQQLTIAVDYPSFVASPASELKPVVYQNRRRDNCVSGIVPTYITGNRVEYVHNQRLIFDAGNEYRRFEMVSTQYKGMGVDFLSHYDPYYHAVLERDYPRKTRTYSFDQTQHGRYIIRETDHEEDSDTQADYFVVHFSLDASELLLPEGDIYIDGELSEYRFSDSNRMLRNPQTGLYEKIMLLKQGAYNYQYLFVPKGENVGKASIIEGNRYETQNEYRVNVYHRIPGERYDRLIGTGRCLSAN